MLARTYGVRSQIDDPEEIGVAAAARDVQIRRVFPGVQQGGVAVGFQADDQLAATVVPQLQRIVLLPGATENLSP